MGRPRATPKFNFEQERDLLVDWVQDPPNRSAALALRCRLVIESAKGYEDEEVARLYKVSPARVAKWRRRYVAHGPKGLFDKPRSGVPRSINVEAVIAKTLEERPPAGTRWTTRSMAQAMGVSQKSVARIWKAYGLDPRQVDIFTLSADPGFVAKVRRVAGLYLNPPQGALVLGVDGRSPTDEQGFVGPHCPILPRPETAECLSGDRPVVLSDLFTALEVAAGRVIAEPELARVTERERDFRFRRFLQRLELSVPGGVEFSVVVDHSSTQMTDALAQLLAQRRRIHLHTAPTHDWWTYLVEWWLIELDSRGSGLPTSETVASINDWLEKRNENPSPFVWVAETPKRPRRRAADA
jgi:transposase